MNQSPAAKASSPESAACTIVSPNYLAHARTVAASYLAQHRGDRFSSRRRLAHRPHALRRRSLHRRHAPEIGLEDVPGVAMKYEILELNTNVKPTFMKHLITRCSLDRLTYLDPDIFLYAPFTHRRAGDALQRDPTTWVLWQ